MTCILMVTPFFSPDHGGIVYHVENIVKNLIKRDHKIILITQILESKKSIIKEQSKESSKLIIYRIKSFSPPSSLYITLKSFRIPQINVFKLLDNIDRKNKIDVVHAHGHHYPLSWLALYWGKKRKRKTVLTLHGMYALDPQKPGGKTYIEELFNYVIFSRILANTTHLIGLTKSLARYALKYTLTSPIIHIIPNGTDIDKFEKNLDKKDYYREKYELPINAKIILYRGRFSQVKGLPEYISVVKKIAQRRKNLLFLFIGGGDLKPFMQKTLRELDNVRLLDWQPPELIHELYIASDIFVLPSRWEALPITLIEAMAARLFIMTTPVGGIPDILEKYDKKIYVQPKNPLDLYKKLTHVITNKLDEKQISENSLRKYLEKFSWTFISEKIEQIYST